MQKETKSTRTPVVAVLGHVDHGKTTLLDSIRKTNVQIKEAGGITQKIGASVVTTEEKKDITFIDTPGHAAFSSMRSQGVNACDIAVLVVAADDGVKPQTVESLRYIKQAKTPFLVALTKTDLQSANVESAKNQLEKEGVALEGRGGDVPVVEVSAKKGQGIVELLQTIILLAEVTGLENLPSEDLEAVVIETNKSKAGNLVSLVVKKGTLEVGEEVVADNTIAKIRGIFDSFAKQTKQVLPGYPAQVLGFEKFPRVGSLVVAKKTESVKVTGEKQESTAREKMNEGQIPVLIKVDSTGSLEAVKSGIPDKFFIVGAMVGNVNESDVILAKSSKAGIFTFNSKTPSSIKKFAKTEGVKIEDFNIIYKLFERLEEIAKEANAKILGRAQIIAEFPFNKKRVAGCKILEGVISKKVKPFLTRGDKQLGKVKILSIKKAKEEVGEVGQAEECGILFVPQLDFGIGDMLVSVENK